MRLVDLDYDQVKLLALKCPLKLPKSNGPVRVDSGEWFAYPAKNEVVKRFTKLAKADALAHHLKGEKNYIGRTVVGGKTFCYYPKASALIRADFAAWCDDHANQYIKKDGGEKLSNRPLHTDKLAPVPNGRTYLEVKDRVKRLPVCTGLMREESWNKEFEMRETMEKYAAEVKYDFAMTKDFLAIPHLQANVLVALCAYRYERDYARAADAFLDAAANAVQAAEWIMKNHSKAKVEANI